MKPDLVLSWGAPDETVRSAAQKPGLACCRPPVPYLSQGLQEIVLIGRLTFTENTAIVLVQPSSAANHPNQGTVAGTTAPKVLLEVDDSTPGKPYVFGGASFGDELLQDAMPQNIFHANSSNGGYPQVTDEAIIAPTHSLLFSPKTQSMVGTSIWCISALIGVLLTRSNLTGCTTSTSTSCSVQGHGWWKDYGALHRLFTLRSSLVRYPITA